MEILINLLKQEFLDKNKYEKFLISLTLLILLTISILILYLSFYGYQTDRFNKIIKSEIEKNQKIINLDFKKISFLLDIKKINLLVKFIEAGIFGQK